MHDTRAGNCEVERGMNPFDKKYLESQLSSEKRALLLQNLLQQKEKTSDKGDMGKQVARSPIGPQLARRAREGALPLSFAEIRLWFLDQYEPGTTTYLIPVAYRIRGALDGAALRRALSDLTARHEPLRTRYVGGNPSRTVSSTHPLP